MPVPPRLTALALLVPLAHSLLAFASTTSFHRRANKPPDGYFNPISMNGSMLTFGFPTYPPGLGEPLNVILSANSDPDVLKDRETDGGMRNYFLSLSFSSECLGQHLGSDQMGNLGDGNGPKNETAVMRYNYGDPALGSCKETVQGGNHFRYWVQNGPMANSGAVFMALSYEKPIADGHDIVYDGYNKARDWLIGNITNSPIPTEQLTNTSTYTGTTQSGGYTYQTSVAYTGGLLENTSDGINHYLTVGGGPRNITAIDGLVAVLQVNITSRPAKSSSTMSSPWVREYTAVFILFFSWLGLGFL